MFISWLLAALWMHPSRGPRTVEVRNGRVTNFHVDEPGSLNTFTFCGLQILDGRILQYLPETGFSSIIHGYREGMTDGRVCAGVAVPESYWADVGTPAQYLDVHRETAKGKGPFAAIDSDATVAADAQIIDSAIWSNAKVLRTARLQDAIVGPGAIAYGETSGVAVRAETVITAAETDCIKQLD